MYPVILGGISPRIVHCSGRHMGVSQNEAAGTGNLSQGSVSRVCFVVCFGGLFRTVLLPRTVKFKGSVSGSVSKVCFGVCFGGLFRQSRTSQPYLKLHSPKKCKPISLSFSQKWPLHLAGVDEIRIHLKKNRRASWELGMSRYQEKQPPKIASLFWDTYPCDLIVYRKT